MNVMKSIVVIIVMSLVAVGFAAAEHQQVGTLDKGKALFNDPKLGTNGKSCSECHQNGKGLENAAAKQNLENIVNTCITKGLQGKALDVQSPEMQSLVSYIKSFGAGKAKKAPVGC